MFHFFNRSEPRYPTIRQALAQSGLAEARDSNRVAVLEKRGQYAGRTVNFFRAFERADEDLLLGSGHVESNGLVVVDRVHASENNTWSAREPAKLADHTDYERLIFGNAAAARSSEATLSAAAHPSNSEQEQ